MRRHQADERDRAGERRRHAGDEAGQRKDADARQVHGKSERGRLFFAEGEKVEWPPEFRQKSAAGQNEKGADL